MDLQKEYDELLIQLGSVDIKLEKPIRFRKTPHSIDVFISEISINKKVEEYGDTKFTILQTLRYLKAKQDGKF